MLAFTVLDTKKFMSQLLKGSLFDDFTFRQGEISSNAFFSINGLKNKEDLDETNSEPYCLWPEIKPFVFQSIKGKKLPRNIKLVLSLPQETIALYPNTKSVFLNLLFRDGSLVCTTASAQELFSLDQQGNQKWDNDVLSFFKKHEITIQLDT